MSDVNNNSSKIGLIGLLVGFAAGALTVILSDPDNRQKVRTVADDALDTAKEKVAPAIDKVAEKVKETADKVQKKIKETASELEDEIASAESDIKQAD